MSLKSNLMALLLAGPAALTPFTPAAEHGRREYRRPIPRTSGETKEKKRKRRARKDGRRASR